MAQWVSQWVSESVSEWQGHLLSCSGQLKTWQQFFYLKENLVVIFLLQTKTGGKFSTWKKMWWQLFFLRKKWWDFFYFQQNLVAIFLLKRKSNGNCSSLKTWWQFFYFKLLEKNLVAIFCRITRSSLSWARAWLTLDGITWNIKKWNIMKDWGWSQR